MRAAVIMVSLIALVGCTKPPVLMQTVHEVCPARPPEVACPASVTIDRTTVRKTLLSLEDVNTALVSCRETVKAWHASWAACRSGLDGS